MYTRLPLAEEIREARDDHDESVTARRHLQRVATTLDAVTTVERQHAKSHRAEGHLPGEALVTELSETWPLLGDLPSAGPRATSPFPQQLQARRTQLNLGRQVLRPIAKQLGDRLEALHTLQQDQRRQLSDPGYARVLQEIQALNAEREAVIQEFQPLKQRLGIVEPTLTLLDNFIASLSADEKAGKAGSDPAGAVAWRTAYVARTFMESVEDVLNSVDFGVPVPEIAAIPTQPDPQTADARWSQVAKALVDMAALRQAIDMRAKAMTATAAAAWERYEEISAKILELTG